MPKRHRTTLRALAAAVLLPALAATATPPAAAAPPSGLAFFAPDPGEQCRAAIRMAERAAAIPVQLMAAIGRVESGRRGPDGRINPWPWSINAEGEDHVFETRQQAIAAVRAFQARGVRSIDVGCMQVNLAQHPDAFASLDAAFDPATNAAYAARFLRQLYAQSGSWSEAAALYHSATPGLKEDYRRKVMAAWPVELHQQGGASDARLALVDAWGATLPAPGAGGNSGGGGGIGYGSGIGPRGTAPALRRMLPGGTGGGRLLPMAAAPAGVPTGHTLAAYRAMPIPLAGRTGLTWRHPFSNGNG